MSQFSPSQVVLHTTGNSASGVVLVGSAFRIPLDYVNQEGEPQSLTGWTLEAKAELYQGEFNREGKLSALQGSPSPLASTPTVVVSDTDTSQFIVTVPEDLLPEAQRDIAVDAEILPTIAIWIRLAAPQPSAVRDQVRIALGYRRGFGSLP